MHQDYVDNKELKEDSLNESLFSQREDRGYDGIRAEIIRLEEEMAQLRLTTVSRTTADNHRHRVCSFYIEWTDFADCP